MTQNNPNELFVVEVFFSKTGDGSKLQRLVIFDIDEDTGAKSVADIIETEVDERGNAFVQDYVFDNLFPGLNVAQFKAIWDARTIFDRTAPEPSPEEQDREMKKAALRDFAERIEMLRKEMADLELGVEEDDQGESARDFLLSAITYLEAEEKKL